MRELARDGKGTSTLAVEAVLGGKDRRILFI